MVDVDVTDGLSTVVRQGFTTLVCMQWVEQNFDQWVNLPWNQEMTIAHARSGSDSLPVDRFGRNLVVTAQTIFYEEQDLKVPFKDVSQKMETTNCTITGIGGVYPRLGQESRPRSLSQRWRGGSSGSSTHGRRSFSPRPGQESRSRSLSQRRHGASSGSSKLRREDFPMSEKKFQKRVLQLLVDIKDTIRVATSAGTAYELNPANTLEELKALENRLEDINEGAELSKHLKRLGGVDTQPLTSLHEL
ncbi:hypothetical protein QQF64_034198 [Cirrhinus molitorella]|uniref:Uncharacterized protein n=1 Tax=Cirrhinus molitorella TaxID=172907 RepID=A0ABR3MW08_9TELE